MKKKFWTKNKGKVAVFSTALVAATVAGNIGYNTIKQNVYGQEPGLVYFAEGFGTGTDFSDSNGSWVLTTNFDSGAGNSYILDDGNKTAIVANNHSAEGEPVIRLINGVENANLNSAESDYRAGTAMSTTQVRLGDNSEFSAKFTISMPDAVVNKAQTNDQGNPNDGTYAREVGGDGIAFIITTNTDVDGQAGGGIGYLNVDDSIVVELDSYFNGAYCNLVTSNTAYVNWNFSNQIYADASYNFLQGVANSDYTQYTQEAYWSNVLTDYAQLPGSTTRRFDHVGVMVDGDAKNHLGISYLNGIDPTVVQNGKYVNLNNASSSQVSDSNSCATRFADENVDNRLFTFWVEYDGTNLYVSYANGNFVDAVRPNEPQIKVENNSELAGKFANQDVKIGFTSAIGSSKANHTVHSVAFVNEYMENGVMTSYKEQYYVESPDATANYITVGTKKYVLREEVNNADVALGSEVTIRDKSNTNAYSDYELVDYSSNPLYPKKAEPVKTDGTTILYQFYDLKPTYTVEYYLETEADDEGAFIEGDKYFKLETKVTNSDSTGTTLDSVFSDTEGYFSVVKDGSMVDSTKKSFVDYVPDISTTEDKGYTDGVVDKSSSLVIKFYYKKAITSYNEKYYVEDANATTNYIELEIDGETVRFSLQSDYDNTVSNVKVGYKAEVKDLSNTTFSDYELVDDAKTGLYKSEETVVNGGNTTVYQFYRTNPKYTVKHYKEASEDATGAFKVGEKFFVEVTSDVVTESAPVGTTVNYTEYIKTYDGYTFNREITLGNNNYSIVVARNATNIVELFYVENETENPPVNPPVNPPEEEEISQYKEMYWVEDPNATKDYVEIEINGVKKKFVLKESNVVKDVEAGTKVTVTDKSKDYSDYELVEVVIPLYPTSSDGISGDGTTTVHQIYVLKPVDTSNPDSGVGIWAIVALFYISGASALIITVKKFNTEK